MYIGDIVIVRDIGDSGEPDAVAMIVVANHSKQLLGLYALSQERMLGRRGLGYFDDLPRPGGTKPFSRAVLNKKLAPWYRVIRKARKKEILAAWSKA